MTRLVTDALARGRNAVAIWQDLVDRHGFSGGYQTVKRFVRKLRTDDQAQQAFGIILTGLSARSRQVCGAIGVMTVAVIAAILFFVAFRAFLIGPQSLPEPIFAIPSLGASLSISIDPLGALFFILIGLISFLGTLYSYRYMEIYPHQSLARFYHCLILFIAGMVGVVAVTDMFFFVRLLGIHDPLFLFSRDLRNGGPGQSQGPDAQGQRELHRGQLVHRGRLRRGDIIYHAQPAIP